MAEIVRRRSCGGVLPLGRHASISGSSVVHCASANIAPPLSKGAKRPKTYPVQARTGPSLPDAAARTPAAQPNTTAPNAAAVPRTAVKAAAGAHERGERPASLLAVKSRK